MALPPSACIVAALLVYGVEANSRKGKEMLENPELREHFGLDEDTSGLEAAIKAAISRLDPNAPAHELARGLVAFKEETQVLSAMTAELATNLVFVDTAALKQVAQNLSEKFPALAGRVKFTIDIIDASAKIREAVKELVFKTNDAEVKAAWEKAEANMAAQRKAAEEFAARYKN